MRFRPMPLLSVLSLISLGILVWLGNWQYARYSQKLAGPAGQVAALEQLDDVAVRLQTDSLAYLQQVYGMMDGEPVWRRYAPARLADEAGWVLVLIDATGGPVPVQTPVSTLAPARRGTFNRLPPDLRRGGMFAADDVPDNNVWYSFDAAGMARQLGQDTLPASVLEPLQLVVRKSDDLDRTRLAANPYAFLTPPDPLPPERHFGYALTWWGLAIALIGVYLAFHHARGRLRLRS